MLYLNHKEATGKKGEPAGKLLDIYDGPQICCGVESVEREVNK